MAPTGRHGQGFHRQPLPRLQPALHELIGRRLRLHHDALQRQPLQGRLAELLEDLARASGDPAAPADHAEDEPSEHR